MIVHVYEVRPRKDHRGFDLISDALPFGRLCYAGPNAVANAIGYAKFYSRSHDAVIRVYDESGSVIETQEHKGEFESRSAIPVRDSGYGAAFIGDSGAIFASVSNRMKVMGAAPGLGEILALEQASV